MATSGFSGRPHSMALLGRRRNGLGAQRFEERRRREDDAPRLGDRVPGLVSLRLDVSEQSGPGEIRHVRHVVVDTAPALFLVCCGDARCRGGGHDVTGTVLAALGARTSRFEGEDRCCGTLGSTESPCERVLRFEAVAVYALA